MKLKQVLNMISPKTNIHLFYIDEPDNELFYGTLLDLNHQYTDKQVLSIDPNGYGELNIAIDLNECDFDDEISDKDLEVIEDLLVENIENNKEQLYEVEDEFKSFYQRRNQKFKRLVEKIENILEEV